MKIITDLITGAGGFNENPVVRFIRGAVMTGLVAAVDYAAAHVSDAPLPPAWAWTLPLVVMGIAAVDKWLRNRQPTA